MVKGTMEEKIYKRQITKETMFHRSLTVTFIHLNISFFSPVIVIGVVDAKQIARHFTYDELAQLYEYDFDTENDPMDKYDVNPIQDKILQNLIHRHSDTIVSYCEHDSFLIHHDEKNLTLEELNQANEEGYDNNHNILI